MLGNTTRAVMALKERLAEHGYEAVIFHSNGVGGPAMEELAEAGQFVGVIDFTTNETYDPMTAASTMAARTGCASGSGCWGCPRWSSLAASTSASSTPGHPPPAGARSTTTTRIHAGAGQS
jgi:hypothetical protein